jgi:hypothetical protein
MLEDQDRADVGSLLKCRLLAPANSPLRFLAGRSPLVLGKRLTSAISDSLKRFIQIPRKMARESYSANHIKRSAHQGECDFLQRSGTVHNPADRAAGSR